MQITESQQPWSNDDQNNNAQYLTKRYR